MIIPDFTTSQNSDTITIVVTAPFCNISELDWNVCGSEFLFCCDPYYLRIDLGNDLEEDTSNCSSYDVEVGTYTFNLAKVFPDKVYENVNWLNTLKKAANLGNRYTDSITPAVTPLSDGSKTSEDESEIDSDEESIINSQTPYGFGCGITTSLDAMLDLIPGVFEVSPVLNFGKRVEHKLAVEEHMIEKNLQFLRNQFSEQPSKDPLEPQYLSFQFNVETIALSENQLSTLNDFKRKRVQIRKSQIKSCYLCVMEMMLSWAYDRRVSSGEYHSESCWNILRLCQSLSCFSPLESIQKSCISFSKRVMMYPLCRSLELAKCCINDASNLLKCGSIEKILCIVLDIYHLMMSNNNEAYYLVNEFFIKRAVVWLQNEANFNVFKAIGEDLRHVRLTLDDLELTQYCCSTPPSGSDIDPVKNEDDSINQIGASLCHVTICCNSDDDSDDES